MRAKEFIKEQWVPGAIDPTKSVEQQSWDRMTRPVRMNDVTRVLKQVVDQANTISPSEETQLYTTLGRRIPMAGAAGIVKGQIDSLIKKYSQDIPADLPKDEYNVKPPAGSPGQFYSQYKKNKIDKIEREVDNDYITNKKRQGELIDPNRKVPRPRHRT